MMFDKFCIEKILSGYKTVTRRIKRNNKRPAIPGKIHKLKIDRTDKTYGYIRIISCDKESIEATMNMNQVEAIKEGFNDADEFKRYWLDKNPNRSNEVWRVEFELLNKNEVI